MNALEIILSIGAGLLVNEFSDISPWAAKKIVIWSARLRYGRSARAEVRAEELSAVIDSRPGKLFKLMTALLFAVGATGSYLRREALFMRMAILIFWAIVPGKWRTGQRTVLQKAHLAGIEHGTITIGNDTYLIVGENNPGKTFAFSVPIDHPLTQIDSTATERDSDDA